MLHLPEVNQPEHFAGSSPVPVVEESQPVDKSANMFPPVDGKIPDSPKVLSKKLSRKRENPFMDFYFSKLFECFHVNFF